MSRWGRGRGGSVAVPLDSALFRENSNCPSAARSAGTVGKWGITSFTSIRSAPYAFGSNVAKKPVQDQNSPLTVPAVETEQPPPKPKKFFKSRNAEPYPPAPQIIYAPPESVAPLSPDHPSNSKGKNKRNRVFNRDSSSPELPRRNSEKGKAKKTVATKASKKEEAPTENSQPPNKRYLVRNRSKVINYAEDGSNSPIPDFTRYDVASPIIKPTVPSPKTSPLPPSPSPSKVEIASPSTSSADDKKPPPIVLRISKGTSRIVSTDSNEGFTSPSSDRHSSMDVHSDFGMEQKKSPAADTICSPKHEGLKITIKCGSFDGGKKEKKRDKKEHKSHKRHHKNSDDEPLKKISSPAPGSDAYELYKTLASPVCDTDKDGKGQPPIDDIECQLAKLDSGSTAKSPKLEIASQPKEPPPEPKPPESSGGRSRRNRPNINYSENDDYLDKLATGHSSKQTKTVSDLKKESKKGKKKQEPAVIEPLPTPETSDTHGMETDMATESHVESTDLIDILSGVDSKPAEKPKVHEKTKPHKKQKYKHTSKHSSPDYASHVPDVPPENERQEEESNELDIVQDKDSQDMLIEDIQGHTPQNTQSSDSAYNSCPNEYSEEETQKQQDDVFKSPHGMAEQDDHDDKPSVKLVITKKKGSIFKSKSLVNDNPSPLPARKRRHLYKHEWNDKGNETPRPEPPENPENTNTVTQVPEELTRVTKYRAPELVVDGPETTETVKPYTSVRCAKEAKEYYTVVRNVKKAHQIQEIGEFQEFNDDVEYLLDALQVGNPMSTRCLSAITLASKCTAPAFRMHLRAHGTVQKFFSALHDATNDQSLGLCTATVMFVLSQDRLNMDMDRESLELMLNLLESDVSHKNALDDCGLTSAQLAKTQERVRELCAEIKSQGKATHLDLENITVGHLAMETLLSLTSKRAGEWFKEELRVLGGVDHIVRTIQDCAARLEAPASGWTDAHVDVLRKADRCMRVLENVTQQNEENQLYLLNGPLGAARTLCGLLRRCAGEARTEPRLRTPLLDAALPAIKVLVNLSHSFGNNTCLGAQVIGSEPSVMEICLMILNNQGNFIPDDKNFEFSVCVLTLLINLIQSNEVNTQRLFNVRIRIDNEDDVISRSVAAVELIVDLFYKREDLARRAEENTDALLDGTKDSDKKKPSQDDIDETVAKLLARAGAHMEHTMVGAYLALVLGHAARAAPPAAPVRARVPLYRPLLPTLKKYYAFLNLTASGEAAIVAHVKTTLRIIEFMEASDKEASQPPAATPSLPQYPPYQYYQTSPSDVPQDMSLSNLNYSMNYNNSSSDRMSSSMEVDGYH